MKGKMKSSLFVQINLQTNTHQYIEVVLKRVDTVAELWREPLQTWTRRTLSEQHKERGPGPGMSNGGQS